MSQHLKIKNAYRLFLVIIGTIGLMVNTQFQASSLLYYTTLSNLLCLLYFAYLLIVKKGEKANFKGAVTLAITVTMLIYWCILAPYSFNVHGFTEYFGALMVHLFVPLMVILDWVFFDEKGRFSKKAPIFWLAIPLTYYAFTVIAATFKVVYPLTNTHYPYYFIDSNMYGWPTVFRNVIVLTLFFLILGYGFYRLDKKLGKK
ncbi:hypothetical protein G6R29_02935 [Fructobacillus sp. M2-14]|uniref:Integral membrane protein n=1 Tax=Fructobacillus broussonetiae TaxID=2713173 RepID=A0ABS5QZI9_9LACO|nr:Pr6Pr family membrane protein [Fructobacillus broussonetiae]MBS9338589.1 hypothetical protein [Fructobacillus broussonetiae]